jgi:hypothetical protein
MNVPSGASTGSEMLRLNLATPPTPIGGLKSRLGALGGDIAGFPNGRRIEDDVTDIALRAVAGATYPLTHPGFTPDPAASALGDGVDIPDIMAPLLSTFPYMAIPNRGYDYNTAQTPGFVRCPSGRVYRLNADQSLGAYLPDPTVIGGNEILTQSATVSADYIKSICGDN